MLNLALFPLHGVLYPGMPIRLVEAFGPSPEPHQIGCQAAVRKIRAMEDGRINLLAVGLQRFRITGLTQVEPFLKAQIESYPLDGAVTPDIVPVRARIRGKLGCYIQKLGQLREDTLNVPELSVDPEILAYSVCNLLQLPLEEKQALLEIRNIGKLLNALDATLGREIALFEALLQRGPVEMTGAFGLN